jgi:hypothetical protein
MIDEKAILKTNIKPPKGGYGFVNPKKDKKAFLYGDGNLSFEAINPSGDWSDFVPPLEIQNKYFETYHCTVFSTIKAILTLIYFKYYKNTDKEIFFTENDKSERFTGVIAGLSTQGGSPKLVADAIRKTGLLPQNKLPWTSDLNSFFKYSAPRPVSEMLRLYGQEASNWLKKYSFGYEYLKVNYGWKIWRMIKGVLGIGRLGAATQDAMLEALTTAPLCASGYSWIFDNNGLAYKPAGYVDNHWFMIIAGEKNKYWLIYDNYNRCWVKCRWEYNFGNIMRYDVDKIDYDELTPEDLCVKYENTPVKGDKKAAIYMLVAFKKKSFKNWITYLAYNWKKSDFVVVPQEVLDQVPEDTPMDITLSPNWEVIKELSYPDNIKKLQEILNK